MNINKAEDDKHNNCLEKTKTVTRFVSLDSHQLCTQTQYTPTLAFNK